MLLLQAAIDTVMAQEGVVSPAIQNQVSLIDLIIKGGWFMVPIGLMGVLAVYLFGERMYIIRNAKKDPTELLNKVNSLVSKGDIQGAIQVCATHNTPMAKMLLTGISHIGSSLKNIEAAIENTGKLEIYRLEKNLSTLGTISGAAPMVGFLGTVTGMISAFIAIAQQEGSVSPGLLAGGIYEAMVTTAGGLVVGILAYLFYNFLIRQISDVINKMEITSIEFIDFLQKPSK